MKKIRIASWNCGGGFTSQQKQNFIKSLNADILICQEPREVNLEDFEKIVWITNQPEKKSPKGLGVYNSDPSLKIKISSFSKDYELIIPFEVSVNENKFSLIAVWAYNKRSQGKFRGKKGMMLEALKHYGAQFSGNAIWMGDFNNGPTIREGKLWEPVVASFQNCDLEQVDFSNSFTHKNNKGSFHIIDHCFVGSNKDFEVRSSTLIGLEVSPSDHAALILDIEL